MNLVRPNQKTKAMTTKIIKPQKKHHPHDVDLPSSLRANELLSRQVINKELYQEMMDIKRSRAETYQNQTRLFLTIGLSLSLLFCIIGINWRSYDDPGLVDLGSLDTDFDEMVEMPPSEQPPPPKPIVEQPLIVEVDNREVVQEIELDFDVEILENTAVSEVVFEEPAIEDEKADQIFQIVEDRPEPQGGMKAFYEYVSENLNYPSAAVRMNVSGNVFVQFVVEKDGSITDVKAVKGIGSGCDEEAVRVIASSPAWNPGKQRGRPVRVQMIMPIRFVLAQR